MSRQRASPPRFALYASEGVSLASVEVTIEADIQAFVHAHPEELPISVGAGVDNADIVDTRHVRHETTWRLRELK